MGLEYHSAQFEIRIRIEPQFSQLELKRVTSLSRITHLDSFIFHLFIYSMVNVSSTLQGIALRIFNVPSVIFGL